MTDAIVEIRKDLEKSQLQIGASVALKNLSKGNAKKVYVASNCPPRVLADIKQACKLTKAELISLKIPNDELGAICKKRFSISVLSKNE
ncbi:MAG: ribosomal L7Ae/L30e/S12e/Gadd45 family protein [Candidatus Woesearchaeota archaeon]|jgi:ribosomal protein L30E|nr:ribosomal L7Ae/L30e/S12e/Gadd45 family protein [Candidatus Woesearchaeota archaeon]MDP7323868.1 ribosomal L7Ae/L30e/S12e/Gadd45 family protein [Candidatus Woesearchaeota archaeon]MDP7458361.1 ribosomal L7Ae/L30e/S12e/Gadd45 family protein [Candidatus Woesearchaeota archaeon]